MAASLSRKPEDSDSRLEQFRSFTVAHPRLVEAKEALVNAIRGAEPNSLIFVFGPTGVGKTTLRLKAERLITEEMLSELHEDRTRVPVVSVEAVAPESGSFNWRDHYKRLLHQLDEPLVDHKLGRQADGSLAACIPRFMPPSKAVGTEYRYAVEQAVRYRRPVAVMIDEAQHLGKIPSGRRLLDQLDVVKSIANQTKTVHVLFGTYDLLAFRNLNGQLSRRSMDVHLARYRAEDSEDRQTFVNIVRSFEKELPLEDRPDLVSDWEFLYERSLGCVGVLKEWLLRAATVASRSGGQRLTKANLEAQALSITQCEQMHAETAHGELQLNETSEAAVRLRARLGLSTSALAKSDPKQPASSVNFRRPGQRLPRRDAIGQVGANAAAL
jgi:energy-coupling factor transporter ATP-binding protein EcfA2